MTISLPRTAKPKHCLGINLASETPPDYSGGVLYAPPTWRGFSLAVPCKASSGFLGGFYSSYINSHQQAFSKQTATPRLPRNAMRHFMQRVGRSAPAVAPFPVPDMPGTPAAFRPSERFMCPPTFCPLRRCRGTTPRSARGSPDSGQISRHVFASGLKIPARLPAREP